MKQSELILRDNLAVERTKLAAERTFLAYFRSSVFFLATGISILQIHFFDDIPYMGWGFIVISPFIFAIGFVRVIQVKRTIKSMIESSDS